MVNQAAIEQVLQINPNQLAGVLENPKAAVHLFIEFDDAKTGDQKKAIKKLKKSVQKIEGVFQSSNKPEGMERFWKVRHSVSTILTQPRGQAKAVPVVEDVSVPVSKLVEFLHRASDVYQANGLVPAAWGQAGDGVVRMQPMLDLGQVGDRQKLFKVAGAIYEIVKHLEG